MTTIFVIQGLARVAPFEMPHLVRSRARSIVAILLVNLALLLAWLSPETTVPIAAAFGFTFLYSFAVGGYRWLAPALTTSLKLDEPTIYDAKSN
ncbi:MAG: hypothetical protein ACKVHO_22820 [Verrucomicrobiia bacterium]|jgi:hypothetical protein